MLRNRVRLRVQSLRAQCLYRTRRSSLRRGASRNRAQHNVHQIRNSFTDVVRRLYVAALLLGDTYVAPLPPSANIGARWMVQAIEKRTYYNYPILIAWYLIKFAHRGHSARSLHLLEELTSQFSRDTTILEATWT